MSEPLRVTREQALAVHDAAISRFGGAGGVRDEGLLESALAQPWQGFGGEDLYPGAIEKACRLAYGVIRDHPFVDGNKRTGAALLGMCLRVWGYEFRPNHRELLDAMLAVADGSMPYERLVAWVRVVVGEDGNER